ncbi:hypothetical protein G7Y89_g6189 [Cudoniella acicularis]|uniref:PARP n=1 Tax=Cudoniella acicularis TaxID=354080 RepID=A0A8H4W340_9HELO|nr:hypothetical protein G7Y89_g6189 [Cudoniella acicularis]
MNGIWKLAVQLTGSSFKDSAAIARIVFNVIFIPPLIYVVYTFWNERKNSRTNTRTGYEAVGWGATGLLLYYTIATVDLFLHESQITTTYAYILLTFFLLLIKLPSDILLLLGSHRLISGQLFIHSLVQKPKPIVWLLVGEFLALVLAILALYYVGSYLAYEVLWLNVADDGLVKGFVFSILTFVGAVLPLWLTKRDTPSLNLKNLGVLAPVLATSALFVRSLSELTVIIRYHYLHQPYLKGTLASRDLIYGLFTIAFLLLVPIIAHDLLKLMDQHDSPHRGRVEEDTRKGVLERIDDYVSRNQKTPALANVLDGIEADLTRILSPDTRQLVSGLSIVERMTMENFPLKPGDAQEATLETPEERDLAKGYEELRVHAKLLLRETRNIRDIQVELYPQEGVPERTELQIQDLEALAAGRISSTVSKLPPRSARAVAREMEAHPGTALDIALSDLKYLMRWLQSGDQSSEDMVREKMARRVRLLVAILPSFLQRLPIAALIRLERQELGRTYVTTEASFVNPPYVMLCLWLTSRQKGRDSVGVTLNQLRDHTDSFLGKKRKLSSEEQETRLLSLIASHPQKDVAIVACAHRLSREAVRELLHTELQTNLGGNADVEQYLNALKAVHCVNIQAVSEHEGRHVEILGALLHPEILTVGRNLLALENVASEVPKELVSCPSLDVLPARSCRYFVEQLAGLKEAAEWSLACNACSWLRDVAGRFEKTEWLLDSTFRQWRHWASWMPNYQRLQSWGKLTWDQRRVLKDVLSLEGPDEVGGKPTLCEGVVSIFDSERGWSLNRELNLLKLNTDAQAEVSQTLSRVLDVLDLAISVSPDAIYLFVQVCLNYPVSADLLEGMEQVYTSDDPLTSTKLLSIMNAQKNSIQNGFTAMVLPALQKVDNIYFRTILASRLKEIVEENVARLQNRLREAITKKESPGPAVIKLHSIGKDLEAAPWLWPMLDKKFGSLLRCWPTKEYLEVLLKVRESAAQPNPSKTTSSLIQFIDRDLLTRFTGPPGTNNGSSGPMEGLLHVWRKAKYSTDREVALTIAGRASLPGEIRGRCLKQLCGMNDQFVSKLGQIMKQETDMACIRMAEILSTGYLMEGGGTAECWKELLWSMIEERQDTIVDFALAQFSLIESWFEWLRSIEDMFQGRVEQYASTCPLLRRPLYAWSKRLEQNYLPSLKQLEEIIGQGSQSMKWVLLGWDKEAALVTIFDIQKSGKIWRCQKIIDAVCASMSRDGGNISQISETISLLTQASPEAAEACCHVFELEVKSEKAAAEGLLAGWLHNADFRGSDESALKSMATFLGMPAGLNSVALLPSKLQAASDHLATEHSIIMAQALRLDRMRLDMKSNDPQKTSKFLSIVGVEDPSALEDVVANVPAHLADVIEKINDTEYEICVPFTHLKPLQRKGLGVGTARILLVRVLWDGKKPIQGFCVHLGPRENPKPIIRHKFAGLVIQSSDDHQYWQTKSASKIPDVHFCRGRPSRAIYQVNRGLWRYLRTSVTSLEEVHKKILSEVKNMASLCLVCGASLGFGGFRSTTCSEECTRVLIKTQDISLTDLRNDPPLLDLLLASIHAACNSHLPAKDVLPGLSIEKQEWQRIMSQLPALDSFQNGPNPVSMKQLGQESITLLSIILTSYRGFLISAAGKLKIPNMPDVHQFVLASGPPEIEQRLPKKPARKILFHGTQFDRLYAILSKGLRSITEPALRANGSGGGISFAEEPGVALSYAGGWDLGDGAVLQDSKFRYSRIVLGCEVAGPTQDVGHGFHLVQDETTVVVRYIFLFSERAFAPARDEIEIFKKLYAKIANMKRGHMDKNGFGDIITEFTPKFEELKQLARELRSVLFPIKDGAIFTGTFRDHDIMYDRMINAFSRTIGRLGKEEQAIA